MAIGVILGRLPWGRWPLQRTLVVIPAALVTIAVGNLQGVDPFIYPSFFILIFAWAGLWHPRWTSLRWAIPAAVAYVGPLLLQHRSAVDIASTASVVPIWILVGETMAWVASRFRSTLAATRMSEVRQRLMYEQMPAVVWSTDRGLRLTSAVGSALASHGIEVEALIGQNVFEVFELTETSANFASREALLGSPSMFEVSSRAGPTTAGSTRCATGRGGRGHGGPGRRRHRPHGRRGGGRGATRGGPPQSGSAGVRGPRAARRRCAARPRSCRPCTRRPSGCWTRSSRRGARADRRARGRPHAHRPRVGLRRGPRYRRAGRPRWAPASSPRTSATG